MMLSPVAKKIIITQSNYIPWKGYFDAFQLVDEWVILDEVQYTRRDWRNRNMLKTPKGLQWLSIPVENKGKFFQKISETHSTDNHWRSLHWNTWRQYYTKAPFFKQYRDELEHLYLGSKERNLSVINRTFSEAILKALEIPLKIRSDSDFVVTTTDATERLIQICVQCGASDYYSGAAAKNYLNEALFEQHHIRLHYLDYSAYPTYPQLYGDFVHNVSALDLLLNVGGAAAKNYLKFSPHQLLS